MAKHHKGNWQVIWTNTKSGINGSEVYKDRTLSDVVRFAKRFSTGNWEILRIERFDLTE